MGAGRAAIALLDEVRAGRRTVADVAADHLDRIARLEPEIRAFVQHDPALVTARATDLDTRAQRGPLHGLPVAVKDLLDSQDQDTGYGSAVYVGHRPEKDAEIVGRLREAGALIMGKSVSTEFALFTPGPTRNPHDLAHTPGGSSSGSAAAVAAGMVPVAIGTQTAGSIIRPASYCGVVGFKPSYGALSREGVKMVSPTFDTPGLLGRDVAIVRTVFDVLRADVHDAVADDAQPTPLRIGVVRTRAWGRLESDAQTAFDRAAAAVTGLPWVKQVAVDVDHLVAQATEDHVTMMAFEAAESLKDELEQHADQLSAGLREFLTEARTLTPGEAHAARLRIEAARQRLSDAARSVDVLLTPATTGEAPRLESTGDPWFCRAWTAFHVPALSLPLEAGAHGLPIGIQLVAGHGRDDLLLTAGAHLERDLGGA